MLFFVFLIDAFYVFAGGHFHFTLENADWSKMVQDEGWDLDNEEDFAEASEAYARFIEDNADKYFQLYLISLAIDEGFHDGEEAYGLDDSETVDFLEFYLYDICGFNSNQITVQLLTENLVVNTNEDLIDTAIQLIESGTPVIYGGYNFNINNNRSHELVSPSIGGHYLFGYDVVEGEDDIVLSKCWNGKDTTTFRTTEYNYLSSIIWLEINEDAFPHVCSSSYDSPINDEEFCVCEIYSQHPNHTHQLYTGLESCPMASFVSRCQCGKAMNWTHKYDTAGYSSTEHWDECVCGDKEHVESHDFVYQQLSNTHHSVTCECGYEGEVMHVFTYTSMSNSVHTGTCACGYSIAEEHNLERVSPRYSVCTQCRYTRDHHLGGNENVHLGIKKEDEND